MMAAPIDMAGARALEPSLEPALAHALADELVKLTIGLADLAYDLAGDPATLRRHMSCLQDIDRMTQAQLAIADILRSGSSAELALQAVTLDELGASVRASLGRYRHEGLPAGTDIDDAA